MKHLFIILALVICCIIPVTATNTSLYPVRGTWFNGDGGSFQTFTTDGEITTFCTNNGMVFPSAHSQHLAWYDATDTSAGTLDFGIAVMPHTYQTDTSVKYGLWLINCKFPSNSTELQLYNGVFYRNETPLQNINADFNATPLSGTGPLVVAFQDNSTGSYISEWNWTVYPETGWFYSTGGASSKNMGITFVAANNYTVMHGVSGFSGSDIELKPNYIYVNSSISLVTMGFRAKDAMTGSIVTGATIRLKDVENNSWVNSSTLRGVAAITVLTGHHVSAYANATGYSDADFLNQVASPWTYDISMIPANYTNVSAGNVTAYITVKDGDTLQVVEGALVTARYQGPTQVTATTNSAGMASFVVPNQSSVYFGASKSGYIAESIVLSTGTGSGGDSKVNGEIKISRSLVTTAPTVTTLPGGGTPSPTQTYLAHCDPSASDYDATKCRQSHSNSSLNLLAENMDTLVGICILVTILYLIGFRLGK